MDDLAIRGGSPIRRRPLPPWPCFSAADLEAADRVLRSGRVNYWTGTEGRAFEAEFARLHDRAHGVALTNGTAALELALHAVGIGPGDDVVVPPRTFIATVSAVIRVGARPVFADVDPNSQNLTATTIAEALTPRTRAILVVHLAGWPCDMDPILELARRHDLRVVEDCAQAQGARHRGRPVGSFGDASAFSFCQDKILTTAGEGGMLLCDDPELWERAFRFKDHGKSTASLAPREAAPVFRWIHESFGTNLRMTELQAAIGRSALPEVPGWLARRRAHAKRLVDGLSRVSALRLPVPPAQVEHAHYRLYAFVEPTHLRPEWNRDAIAAAIQAEGIPCSVGSCPEVYRERAFAGDWWPPRRLPNASLLGDTSLAFLVHPTLQDGDVDDTLTAITKVMEVASS